MNRGIRGATTVEQNETDVILNETEELILEMIERNNIVPEKVSYVLLSTTPDVNAVFPAKVIRSLKNWMHVPVMCMSEIDVPEGLAMCIRIMVVYETNESQQDINHVFLNDAVKLRPDLVKGE